MSLDSEAGQPPLGDRVALVTGATSGIGQAAAVALAGAGAMVFVTGRAEDRGREVVERIRSEGGHAEFVAADLADSKDIERMFERVRRHGRLDILVNNAAHFGVDGRRPIAETPDDVWDRTFAVNLRAVFTLCKLAIPLMIEAGRGSIVNVSSIGGIDAFPRFGAYVSSKGGLHLLTRSIALDYGRHGIRANVVCPGAIHTPGNEPFIADFPDWQAYDQAISAPTALGRAGHPDEVAQVILFLAGDAASYVTGVVIPVDGGRLLGA